MRTGADSSSHIPGWLSALGHDDGTARQQLVQFARVRYEALARRMLRNDFKRLARWMDTGDLLQAAIMRLWRALEDHVPPDELAFQRLVAKELRRELIDMARKYFGPEGIGKNHHSHPGFSVEVGSAAPAEPQTICLTDLAEWTEFHEHAAQLPEKFRDVFDLRYYCGLRVEDTAVRLGVSKATVKLRWAGALRELRAKLGGRDLPGEQSDG